MRNILKWVGISLGGLVALVGIGLLTWNLIDQERETPIDKNLVVAFEGTLLAMSDADQIASAYANGVVNKIDGIEDSLSILAGDTKLHALHVSNSVVGWPAIISYSPRNQKAFVIETRAPFPEATEQVKNVWQDTPKGTSLQVVDLKSPQRPKILQQQALALNPHGVTLNSKENLLAIGSEEKGKEIVIVRLTKEGLIDKTFYFPGPFIDASRGTNAGINALVFHPKENILAININNQQVLFYEVQNPQGNIKLIPIGEPLKVAKCWSIGNWHPNGNYFLLSDVAWGQGSAGFILNGRGSLVSVAFDPEGKHRIASKVKVGKSPEGFDISPDGQYAVTVNMERSYLPSSIWFIPGRKRSSLSLIKIDPKTGELKKLGKKYGFSGALPEDVAFDAEGNSLAVAVYHDYGAEFPERGYVEYWERQGEKLIRSALKVPVTRGVHSLEAVF
ncbi:MAG: hypothetical protein AAFU64_02670 [Bacteroidota bacterium]